MELVKCELRKIVSQRFGMMACLFALVVVLAFGMGNALSQETFDPETGERVYGADAIAVLADRAQEHAGALTPERVEADLQAYEAAEENYRQHEDMTPEEQFKAEGAESVAERLRATDSYYAKLDALAACSGTDDPAARETDLAAAYGRFVQATLDGGYADGTPYAQAERDFWQAHASEIASPREWGYVGGWAEFNNYIGFMSLAIIAGCIALSPVFAGERASRMDAVVLHTRFGKSRLVRAKVIASFLFLTCYFVVCVAAAAAVALGFFGAGGFDLPLQAYTFSSPYGLTVGQATLATIGLMYLVTLGCGAFTLLLSAKLPTPLPAAVIPMAVIFLALIVGGMVPQLTRALAWMPWNVLNGTPFDGFMSYALGPAAVDLVTFAAAVYLLLIAVCVPWSARAFKRHQVA